MALQPTSYDVCLMRVRAWSSRPGRLAGLWARGTFLGPTVGHPRQQNGENVPRYTPWRTRSANKRWLLMWGYCHGSPARSISFVFPFFARSSVFLSSRQPWLPTFLPACFLPIDFSSLFPTACHGLCPFIWQTVSHDALNLFPPTLVFFPSGLLPWTPFVASLTVLLINLKLWEFCEWVWFATVSNQKKKTVLLPSSEHNLLKHLQKNPLTYNLQTIAIQMWCPRVHFQFIQTAVFRSEVGEVQLCRVPVKSDPVFKWAEHFLLFAIELNYFVSIMRPQKLIRLLLTLDLWLEFHLLTLETIFYRLSSN